MKVRAEACHACLLFWGFLIVASVVTWGRAASGYTPESPEVRAMLGRAMAYMSKASLNDEHSEQVGGQALMGLAAYKYQKRFGGGKGLPPMTQTALGRVLGAAGATNDTIYSLGIGLIFLAEVHPNDHMDAIESYLRAIEKRQKKNGGWGYEHEQRGDTSQMQYAVLGCWAAKNAGLEPSKGAMEAVTNYLLRTQDPSGAWGYQGNDPGTFTRVPQSQIRLSLAAAGLGSIYVASDYFGMKVKGKPKQTKSGVKLPPALMPVFDDKDTKLGRLAGTTVDAGRLKQAMNDGNNWFRKNFKAECSPWPFYYLYALERCESFREKVEGTYEEEPRWYNEGVKRLLKIQTKSGAFDSGGSPAGADKPVGTAFAMLFLLRSTRLTIEEVLERDGILHGARGLPSDLTDLRIRGDKLVAPKITGDVEDLISMLEDEEGDKIENMLENPDALSLSGLSGAGRQFTARLIRILRSGSYKARIVAARTLGAQGNLDNVPILIYALTDGDPRVVMEARDGLRLIGRKFDGMGLADKPSEGEKTGAAKRWKEWYLTVRPDAVFLD